MEREAGSSVPDRIPFGDHLDYLRSWLWRAVVETWRTSRKESIPTVIVGVLGAAVYQWHRTDGWPWQHRHVAHPVDVVGLLIPGLVGGFVAVAIFLLFHLVTAPHRLAREAKAQYQMQLTTQEQSHQEALVAERQAHQTTRTFLEHEQESREMLKTQISALQTDPVPEPHRDTIRRIASSVAESIQGGKPCNFADPQSALIGPDFRRAIEVHCHQVIGPCDRWDSSLEEITRSDALLVTKVESEVNANFSEPWLAEWVAPVVLARLRSWASNPTDLSEFPMNLNHNEGSARGDSAFFGGFMVYHKPGLTGEEVRAAESTLNGFVLSLTDSAEVTLLRIAYAGRDREREPALITALGVLDPHSLPRGEGCPLC